MLGKKLFQIQDGSPVTKSGLLYYPKSISIAMLSNVYTLIGLVNGVRYQVVGIISDENGMLNFW